MSNQDFRPVETPWGLFYLHTNNRVWYVYYSEAERRGGWGQPNLKIKGLWYAFFAPSDYKGEKPWTVNNWKINNKDMITEQEAIDACLEHLA